MTTARITRRRLSNAREGARLVREALVREQRLGRVLSAATAQTLLDVIETIEKLLVDAGAVDAPDAPGAEV